MIFLFFSLSARRKWLPLGRKEGKKVAEKERRNSRKKSFLERRMVIPEVFFTISRSNFDNFVRLFQLTRTLFHPLVQRCKKRHLGRDFAYPGSIQGLPAEKEKMAERFQSEVLFFSFFLAYVGVMFVTFKPKSQKTIYF